MLRHGLLRIQCALQNTIKTSIVKESFEMTGMYPFDLDKSLSKCPAKRSEEVDNKIRVEFPNLVKIFYSNGELKDSEMERAGILSTIKIPTPKDE